MSFKPIYTLLDWVEREYLDLNGLLHNRYAVDLIIELEEIQVTYPNFKYCDIFGVEIYIHNAIINLFFNIFIFFYYFNYNITFFLKYISVILYIEKYNKYNI